jgi:hypothetical protein
MEDVTKNVELSGMEKLDSARQVLTAEAASYMISGYPLEQGQGTVSTNRDGSNRISGINKDLSVISWDENPTRTVKTSPDNKQVVDRSTDVDSGFYVQHLQIIDTTKNPQTSRDELALVSKNGVEAVGLKGTCTLGNDGSSDCEYNISSRKGDTGTAHVTFTPIDANRSTTTIHVKTNDVDAAAELKFTKGLAQSAPTAAYDYKKL